MKAAKEQQEAQKRQQQRSPTQGGTGKAGHRDPDFLERARASERS